MPAGHLMINGTEYPTQAVTRYSVTFPAVYIVLIPYNLLALHNQNAVVHTNIDDLAWYIRAIVSRRLRQYKF